MPGYEYQVQGLFMLCGRNFDNTMPAKPDGSTLQTSKKSCYVAWVGSRLPTFRDNLLVLDCLIPEYGTDMFSRNVGTQLPAYTE